MSKDGLDFDKLESLTNLKPKKTESNSDMEKAVKSIHNEAPKKERVKRITIDLPFSVYVDIRKKIIEEEKTLKDYFLELALNDLNLG